MKEFKNEVFTPKTPDDLKNEINLNLQHWQNLYETVSGWVSFKDAPLDLSDVAIIMSENEIAHDAVMKYFSEGGEGYEKQPEFSRDKILQLSECVILELRDKLKLSTGEQMEATGEKFETRNFNESVLVRLTEQGQKTLNDRFGYGADVDQDGYSNMTLSNLMETFGSQLTMNKTVEATDLKHQLPFHLDFKIASRDKK